MMIPASGMFLPRTNDYMPGICSPTPREVTICRVKVTVETDNPRHSCPVGQVTPGPSTAGRMVQ